ncbi:MAG: phosphotransferase family protein, partial [candidate division NC10 bacterium]
MSSEAAAATPVESLHAGLEAFIAGETGHAPTIRTLSRLPGGTMREAWALDVEIAGGAWAGAHRLVLLADCGAQILYSRVPRDDELRVIAAMHAAGVPAPRAYWCIPEGAPHGLKPGLLMERVEGETVARRLLADPAYAAVRPRLLDQMAGALARMHAVPAEALAGLPGPASGQLPIDFQLAEIEASLRALGEPHPARELGLRWLRRQMPPRERLVVVHGDYRLGNVVVDPLDGLRAVLDWELAHLGDPGEDVG